VTLFIYREKKVSACSFWKGFSSRAALILASGLVEGEGKGIATAFCEWN